MPLNTTHHGHGDPQRSSRHRRHVQRARAQGRADGPDTIDKMRRVANAAKIARVTAEDPS